MSRNTLYKPRIATTKLQHCLNDNDIVLVEGIKWCGKTQLAQQFTRSLSESDGGAIGKPNPSHIPTNHNNAEENTIRLLDEWQENPIVRAKIGYIVDHRNPAERLILTSSIAETSRNRVCSDTGRCAYLRIRPMSLYESGDSEGQVSLARLFEHQVTIATRNDTAESSTALNKIAFLACRGGWPETISLADDDALAQARGYCDRITNEEIFRINTVRRNHRRAEDFMRAYASGISNQMLISALARKTGTDRRTVAAYIAACEQIFAIEEVPAWTPNLRLNTETRIANKRCFVDPSLATSAMHLSPNDLLSDTNTFSSVFWNLCIRDLRVYLEPIGGKVYHYRDKDGRVCDAVLILPDGRYGLVQTALTQSPGIIKTTARRLKRIISCLDLATMPAPAFTMLLTASGPAAYQRPEDGLLIVPITSLQP